MVANNSKLKSISTERRRKSREKEDRRHVDSRDNLRSRDANSSNVSRIATNPDSDIEEDEERVTINIPSTKSSKFSRYFHVKKINRKVDRIFFSTFK